MGIEEVMRPPSVSSTRTRTPSCLRPTTASAPPADAPISAAVQRAKPLHLAAVFYGPAAAERFIEKGVDVNVKDDLRVRPPPRRCRVAPNNPPHPPEGHTR